MESIVTVVKYVFLGFAGLVGLLVVAAMLFGKRIRKEWEYEAEFGDDAGREFGEFDIESSRIEKEEPNFSLKAKFRMRHESMRLHQAVEIYLDDLLVLEGMVSKEGRIFLNNSNLRNEPANVAVGQSCRVVVGGNTLFTETLRPD